ncbi:hypothetical protein K474DRAFT_1246068 [Panus rudis PR-1116 ss-1]|nr:hypothetical protein K474DRAFT_1246068 [Panus rudis PR-1116 ss-1]
MATSSNNNRRRGSILVAASDALSSLSFTSRRRRPPFSRPSTRSGPLGNTGPNGSLTNPIVLSEVIEISASTVSRLREEEEEEKERERLREMAAQSLGLGPALMADNTNMADDDVQVGIVPPQPQHPFSKAENVRQLSGAGGFDGDGADGETISSTSQQSPTNSTSPTSLAITAPMTPLRDQAPLPSPTLPLSVSLGRARSGSHSHSHSQSQSHTHSRHSPSNSFSRSLTPLPSNSSATNTTIPAFPTTPDALKPFIQLQGTFPKHYPPHTLLRFAFGTKQWKTRFVVFTSPGSSASNSPQSPVGPSGSLNGRPSTSGSGGAGGPSSSSTYTFRTNSPPTPSYLHVFKSSAANATELERLEINEDSVVFIADSSPPEHNSSSSPTSPSPSSPSVSTSGSKRNSEAAAGRKGIIQVGGVDVGLNVVGSVVGTGAAAGGGNGTSGEERTMWLLQILDGEEAKKWIGAIKHAVLSQRSMRAGLGPLPRNPSGSFELRGDLDVMLSIRAQQALLPIHSPSASPITPSPTTPDQGSTTPRVQSPVQSLIGDSRGADLGLSPPSTMSRAQSRAAATSPTPSSRAGAVSALKGLFSGSGRPRSPSAASILTTVTSTDSGNNSLDIPQGKGPEESFGSVGTNLLMMRSNSISSSSGDQRAIGSPTSSTFTPVLPPTPSTPKVTEQQQQSLLLDRQILSHEEQEEIESSPHPMFSSPSGLSGNGRHSIHVNSSSNNENLQSFGSPSLQPPPRRKAWTSSGNPSSSNQGHATVSSTTYNVASPPSSAVFSKNLQPEPQTEARGSSDTPPPSYSYHHANGSTAESFGVGVGSKSGLSSPTADGSRSHARTSWSSSSSFASNDHGSSPETFANGNASRRWSRHNSMNQPQHRLTPPNGSPSNVSPLSPALPSNRLSGFRPSVDSTSPSSSLQSSPPSLVLDLRPLSPKRTSSSSVQSNQTTTSTNHSRGVTTSAVGMGMFSRRNSHRISAPPPQRPVPLAALPPTPSDDPASSSSAGSGTSTPASQTPSMPSVKSSLKEMLASRSHRLSLSPPTQPPTSALPPRPDEPDFANAQRRSLSNGSAAGGHHSLPPSATQSPYPPPSGSLPPTPSTPTIPATALPVPASQSQSSRQSRSFVRRFRNLSAPTSAPPTNPLPPIITSEDPRPIPNLLEIPATPIGEPITTLQNDPDFLPAQPETPPPPREFPLTPLHPPPPESSPTDENQGIISLSPPPRRSSRRISTPDKEPMEHEVVRLSSIVTLRDPRRERDSLQPIPSPLPPSPLSPPYHSDDQAMVPQHDLTDSSVENDDASQTTASTLDLSPSQSPMFQHSSPHSPRSSHSAVSLLDDSI